MTLIEQLESILTIDGQGRPRKAKQLLDLIKSVPLEELEKSIKELSDRKFF